MSFTIFSYCSQNYFDAYQTVIESWVRAEPDRIIIYTDWDLEPHPSGKVIVHANHFEPSTDWLENCGRKIEVAGHFFDHYQPAHTAFLDIDCYVTRNFSESYQGEDDLRVTRWEKRTVTCGVWFASNPSRMRDFVRQWRTRAQHFRQTNMGVQPHYTAFDQYAFDELVRQAAETGQSLRVGRLPADVYNNEMDDREPGRASWLQHIDRHNPAIIHMKHQAFRDLHFVSEINRRYAREPMIQQWTHS